MLQPSSAADKANCLDKWNTLASSWISHGPEKLPEYLGEEVVFQQHGILPCHQVVFSPSSRIF